MCESGAPRTILPQDAKVGHRTSVRIGKKLFDAVIKFKGTERQAEEYILTSQGETDADIEDDDDGSNEVPRAANQEAAPIETEDENRPGTPDTEILSHSDSQDSQPTPTKSGLTPREALKRDKYLTVNCISMI